MRHGVQMQFAGSNVGGNPLQPPAANRAQQGSKDAAPCSMLAPSRTLGSTLPMQRHAPAQHTASQHETMSTIAEPVTRTLPSLRSSDNTGDPPVQGSVSATDSGTLRQHVHAAAHADLVSAPPGPFAARSSMLEPVQHAQSHCDGLDQRCTHQQQASRENPRSSDGAAHSHSSKPSKPHAEKPAAKDMPRRLVSDVKSAGASQLDVASKPADGDNAAMAHSGAAQTLRPAAVRLTRLSRQALSGSADADKEDEKADCPNSSSSNSEGAYSFQDSSDEECRGGSVRAAGRGKGANRQTVAHLKAR